MPNEAITLSQRESHLWKAAWLLKAPVDAADFKTYIFPLLFFKRLSDVHDEEHEASLKEFKTGRAQNELLPEHVERIHGWYCDLQNVEGIARVVILDEIAANDHNLNIPRYVEPKVDQVLLTVEEAMKRLRESAEAAFAEEENLVGILKGCTKTPNSRGIKPVGGA